MQRKIIVGLMAGIASIGLASAPAAAQDKPEFEGFYIGGSVGYDVQPNDINSRILFDTNQDGRFNDTVLTTTSANAFSPGFCNGAARSNIPDDSCRNDSDGINYAGKIGYDAQFGHLVFGVVAEIGKNDISDSVSAFSTTPASYTFSRRIDYVAAFRTRLGYAADRTLFYGAFGPSYAGINHSFTTTNGANSFTGRERGGRFGFQAGGGIEQKISKHISFGLEYMYNQVNDSAYRVRVGPGTAPVTNPFLIVNATGTDLARSDSYFRWHSMRATLNFRF